MNFKPCRSCPFRHSPCEIRDAMRATVRAITWPAVTKPTNLNFRCERRDEGFAIGERVYVQSNVCRGYGEDELEEWSGSGVIVGEPRGVNERWLVYLDRDPDWLPSKPAGRFHRDRLELVGETEQVCSCGNPARARPAYGPYGGDCDCPEHQVFQSHQRREREDFRKLTRAQGKPDPWPWQEWGPGWA